MTERKRQRRWPLGIDTEYFFRGGTYMGLASFGSGALLFFSHSAVSRLVPKSTLGEYQIAMTLVSMAMLLAYPKIPAALIAAIARKAHGTFRYGMTAMLKRSRYAIGALLVAAAYYAATGAYGIAWGAAAGAALFTPYAISGLYESYWIGNGNARKYAIATLQSSVLVGGAMVFSAIVFPNSSASLVAACLGATGMTTGLWALNIAKNIPNESAVNEDALSFGKRTSWAEAVATTAHYADILLIGAFLDPRAVAVYGIARMMPEGIKGLIKNIGVLSVARIATMEREAVRDMLALRLAQAGLAAFLITIAYIAFAPALFRVFFPTYPEALPYSALLAVSFMALPAHLAESALVAFLKKKSSVILAIGSASATLTLSLLLIPAFGIAGAVIAKVASRFLSGGLALALAVRSI